jgi:hypothetical protein
MYIIETGYLSHRLVLQEPHCCTQIHQERLHLYRSGVHKSIVQQITGGDRRAARRAGPGDAEHKAREGRLLLGHPAGLREEADVYGPALLHGQVPGMGAVQFPPSIGVRFQGFVSCWLPVPEAELERIGAAVGAGAEGVDAPLRQPGDGLHAGVRGAQPAAAEAHAAAVAEQSRAAKGVKRVSARERERERERGVEQVTMGLNHKQGKGVMRVSDFYECFDFVQCNFLSFFLHFQMLRRGL